LSLSPDPDNFELHVLNTFQFSDFMALLPELADKKTLFVIGVNESWTNSHFARAAHLGIPMVETLLKFETCFEFLTSDTYKVAGEILDTSKLHMGQYLNRVKAYRMAEIYKHPEKYEEAVKAIRNAANNNEMAKRDLDRVCAAKSPGSAAWLYSPRLITALCAG